MAKNSDNRLVDILVVVFISIIVGMLAGGSAVYTMSYKKNDNSANLNTELAEIGQIYEKIVDEYYGTVDQTKLVEAAISGMLSVLDKNTTYFNEGDTTSFNNKMKGEYYGIGVEVLTVEDSGILVMSVLDDSPSRKAGLEEGDMIVAINGESLVGKTASYFNSLISSKKDSIKLTISRNETNMTIGIVPKKIVIESVTSNTFYRNSKKIGYLKISIFAANTASQFTTKLKQLEENGIDSLIIDVRNNTGGYLSNVATILELFMKKGEVLYKIESKNSTYDRKDSTEDKRDYPVTVLVNSSSASASEILASCFRDNRNSDIIGTTTYGKGTVQETVNVLDNSMAKITTKKWLTPNGNWINGKGIEPTISVDLNNIYNQNPIYDNDNQLEMAVDIISKK